MSVDGMKPKNPAKAPKKSEDDSPAEKLEVIFFPDHTSFHQGYRELMDYLRRNKAVQVVVENDPVKALTRIREKQAAIVFFWIKDPQNLREVLTILVSSKDLIMNKKWVRVLGFNDLDNPQVRAALMKNGCMEVLEPSTKLKALQHKADRLLKILQTTSKARHRAATDAALKGATGGKKKAKPGADNQKPGKVDWVEALTLKSDCWLIQKRSHARKVMGRWLIDIVGPPPSAGKWEPYSGSLAGKPLEAGKAWVWRPRAANDAFISEQGSWIFVGRTPEYSRRTMTWNLVSDSPILAWESTESPVMYRFRILENSLHLCRNSDHAMKKLPDIHAAFGAETVVFDKKGDKKELGGPKKLVFSKEAVPNTFSGDYRGTNQGDGVDWSVAEEDEGTDEVTESDPRDLGPGGDEEGAGDEEAAEFDLDAGKPRGRRKKKVPVMEYADDSDEESAEEPEEEFEDEEYDEADDADQDDDDDDVQFDIESARGGAVSGEGASSRAGTDGAFEAVEVLPDWDPATAAIDLSITVKREGLHEEEGRFFDFIEPDMLVLEVAKPEFNPYESDASVSVLLYAKRYQNQVELDINAKIMMVEPYQDGRELITIGLQEFDPFKMEQFQKIYADRQKSIAGFMKAVRD